MTRLRPLPRRPRATHARARTGAVGLAAVLLLSLAACKGDDAGPLTPAGAALVASAPAVAATKVPPPPVIQSVSTDTAAAGGNASLMSIG